MAPSTHLMYPLVALLGLAAAVPAPQASCDPQTICIDAINTCGVKYGGCYDVCNTALKPTPPPCTNGPTCTVDPPTSDPPTTTTSPITSCNTRTLCWDGINECGQTYGGCYPDCSPWPTFTPPPCPTSTTVTPEPVPTTDPPIICIDYINECGKMYGGCVPSTSPFPTFSKPPCP